MGIPICLVRTRRTWLTVGLSVLFVLCWASGFIGAKLGAAEAPVTTLLAWRFLPLAIVLLLLTGRGRATSRTAPGEVGRHALVGLLSQSGYLLTVYWAIGLGVSTGTTALIDGVQPLVAAALVGPVLGVVVSGRQWAALTLGLAGVVLVCWTDATSSGGQAPTWAYVLPFAGMLSLVGSTLIERRAPRAIPKLRALTIHCATSAVVFVALAVGTGTFLPPASGRFWLATAWLVVLSTFGGYGLYWLLVERIGVTPVNSLMFLIAPVTSVWGAMAFGEPLTGVTVAGLALTLVAALVATWGREEAPADSAPAHRISAAARPARLPAPGRRRSSTLSADR
jgi:drug/metabolite transporter (DMT)-like permease